MLHDQHNRSIFFILSISVRRRTLALCLTFNSRQWSLFAATSAMPLARTPHAIQRLISCVRIAHCPLCAYIMECVVSLCGGGTTVECRTAVNIQQQRIHFHQMCIGWWHGTRALFRCICCLAVRFFFFFLCRSCPLYWRLLTFSTNVNIQEVNACKHYALSHSRANGIWRTYDIYIVSRYSDASAIYSLFVMHESYVDTTYPASTIYVHHYISTHMFFLFCFVCFVQYLYIHSFYSS